MARIRTIKPDFFTSEDIVSLTPMARLLFIATWLEADRAGRFSWRPKTMKLRYLPGDDCNVEELADELLGAGLIVTYEINGQLYAEIPSFIRHQVINNRESESAIPARESDATVTREARVNNAITTPLMGKEGKGKEGHSTRREQYIEADNGFAQFWALYPVKKSKQDALRAWQKLKPTEGLLTTILSALGDHKASSDWLKDGGKFIPHPASWLNGRRWEDEIACPGNVVKTSASVFVGAI